jgi:hypothetical protein
MRWQARWEGIMKATHFAVLAAFACMASSAAAQEATAPVATEQTPDAAPAAADSSTPTEASGDLATIEQTQAPEAASAPQIPLGERVLVEIVDPISSNTATLGQLVALRTVQPISAGGAVVIPAGTPGVGEVIDVRRKALGGVPGLLVVASRHLDLNGQQVRLEGMIVGASGQGFDVGTASAFMGAGAAFIPGRDFEVPAGSRATARIAGGPPRVAAPVEGRNPVPSPPAGKAYVVFYHRAQMGGEFYTYGAAENGVTLARLRGNRYFAVAVDPGQHSFEVLAPMGGRRTGVTIRQEILEGQIIFIRHDDMFFSPGDVEDFMARRLREAPAPTADD